MARNGGVPLHLLGQIQEFINRRFIQTHKGNPLDAATPENYRMYLAVMNLKAARDPVLLNQAQPHSPNFWIPLNVLGEGGFGIATLWQYNGPAEEYKGMKVVIKIGTGGRGRDDMVYEGNIMNELSGARSEHLTNMIYAEKDFTRLYLEFCYGGDLYDELRRWIRQRRRDEEQLWRLFLCLCKGLCAMHELPTESIVIHYDLKPANVLIQPDPTIHGCLNTEPLYKLADFGLADLTYKEERDQIGSVGHASRVEGRGTPHYWAPELYALDQMESLDEIEDWKMWYQGITPKLDIWTIGCIMWQFMVLSWNGPSNGFEFPETAVPGDNNWEYFARETKYTPAGSCYGKHVLYSGYSDDLTELVQWCLMKYPQYRCSSSELLPHLEEKVAWFNTMRGQLRAAPATVADEPGTKSRLSELQSLVDNLNKFLAEQGRTKAYYDELQRTLPSQERQRLVEVFVRDRHSSDWRDYATIADFANWDAEDEEFVRTYQLAFEATQAQIYRCFRAYQLRANTRLTRATRMELVRRQLRYEATQEYRDQLIARFNERNTRHKIYVDDTTKFHIQRAYEETLLLTQRPQHPNTTEEDIKDWMTARDAFEERFKKFDMWDKFFEQMEERGIPEHLWSNEMVKVQERFMGNPPNPPEPPPPQRDYQLPSLHFSAFKISEQ